MSTTESAMSDQPQQPDTAEAELDSAPATPTAPAVPPRDVGGDGPDPVPPAGPYAAKRGAYYINVRYVIVLAILVMSAWFMYDGWVAWPEERASYLRLQQEIDDAQAVGDNTRASTLQEEQRQYDAHDDYGITANRVLGFVLPPIGIALLVYWLRASRGTVRLDEQDVLHVPGHPPVPAASIGEIDDDLWDRKGISYLYYDADGQSGRIKLDDFVYERGPIEKIHNRLVHLRVGDERATDGL